MTNIPRLSHRAFGLALGLALIGAQGANAEEQTPEKVCAGLPPEAEVQCRAAADLLMSQLSQPMPDLTIKVTATDGKLAYHYELPKAESAAGGMSECITTDALVFPTGRRIRLFFISYDMSIYTWRIPSWNISRDLVPGRMNEAIIEPMETSGVVEGRLIDENKPNETLTEIRIINDAYDANGYLKAEALCKS